MSTTYSNRSKSLALVAISGLLLWTCRGVFQTVFFPQYQYFTANSLQELPEEFRHWAPPEATSIRVRTYQSGYWITSESQCNECDAVRWAASINHPLDSLADIPDVPDHSLPADQLGFISIPIDKERYCWRQPQAGGRTSLVYDRNTKTLYVIKNSG